MYSIWAFALVALEADCGQFWMKHSAGKGVATELDFFVRFWGVRGSIPCPGEATSRYGGNTSCIEVRCGEHLLIFDAGTGFSELGKRLRGEGPLDADLFLTHTHYDHIWGWPHFYPGLEADTRLHIRAGHLIPEHCIEELMLGLLNDPLNPLNSETLRARIVFEDFVIGSTIEPRPGIVVRTAHLNHPNRASGYRIEFDGRSICYLTDHEHTEGGPDKALVELTKSADLVIYDSTYTDEEYPNHVGWGHSTWNEGVKLCNIADAGTFVIFHHDPGHDDNFMDQIALDASAARPGTVVAREGLVLRP